MKLYRSVVGKKPWTGAGSFWSPDPKVALKYGPRGGTLISIETQGRALEFQSDAELVKALARMGINNAEDRVLDAAWIKADVFAAFQRKRIDWIIRPVDPSVSLDKTEWIYVGAGKHSINAKKSHAQLNREIDRALRK